MLASMEHVYLTGYIRVTTSSSSATQSWWDDQELGTAAVDNEPSPVPLHPDLLHDYVEHNSFDEDDDEYISDY